MFDYFLDSIDIHKISKIILFNFFKCIIHYGPDLAFSVRIIFILIYCLYLQNYLGDIDM
jgi:hypothetical protein